MPPESRPPIRLRTHALEAAVALGVAAVVTAVVIALYLRINPDYFVVNDARDSSLPQGFEMARLMADGQIPVFTTRAISGGNQLVGFGAGPLHPVNALVWNVWSLLGTPARVGMAMVAALGVYTYAGAYFLARATGRATWLHAHLAGTTLLTAPIVLVFTLPGWWNHALGVGAFAWALGALILLRRRASGARVLLLGAATWGVFTSGWPHAMLALGVSCLVVGVPMLLGRGRPWGSRVRDVATLALPVVAGVLAALPAFSEFLAVGDQVARSGSFDNVDNALVPSVNQLLAVANPIAGDFMSAWGFGHFTIPFGFVSLLVLVALFFSDHAAARWRSDWLLHLLLGSAAAFYLATQLPSNLGPFRWPIRFLSFAVVCVVAATIYYLRVTPRVWTVRRFLAASVVVALGAAYAASRVPDPAAARRGVVLLPLLLLVGCTAAFGLYARHRLRTLVEVGLVVAGVFAVWAMPPGPWFGAGLGYPQRQAEEHLADAARGGFLLDVHAQRDGWAPGLSSSRYLWAGISVVNGYDPVRHAGFTKLVRARDQGYLEPEALERLTGSPSHWPDVCWTDALRVSAVITQADPVDGRHELLERCGFRSQGTEGNATLFTVQRGLADPRSTVAVADPNLEISADTLVTERIERLTVTNTSEVPGRVTFARLAWPGYHADLDGEPLVVGSVDGATVQVTVPAHAHGVLTLAYTPVSWPAAWIVAGLGLAGLMVLAFLTRRKSGVS